MGVFGNGKIIGIINLFRDFVEWGFETMSMRIDIIGDFLDNFPRPFQIHDWFFIE